MKNRELISLLEKFNDDSEVFVRVKIDGGFGREDVDFFINGADIQFIEPDIETLFIRGVTIDE